MTRFKFIAFLLCTMMGTALSFGQAMRTIKPRIGRPNNYSKQAQIKWQSALDKYTQTGSGDLEYEKLSATDKALIDSLEMGAGPLTQGAGCSWYCGGDMYKVTADSYLPAQGNVTYKPTNVHDFDLLTAWVPDTTNGAIGKKIHFHFKPLSPRVNEIMIYNGYIKNYELFKANSRVKKFKMYVNGSYYASLELADTTAQQSFSITPLQSKDKQTDLIMTFEIVEIYKGDKYTDVAVSEINFSGLDVH